MSGYKPSACVPALEIAKKCLRQDKRAEPLTGERVPYVIVYKSPGLPLELISDPGLHLNATDYSSKQILPPMDRFLFLLLKCISITELQIRYQDMPHSTGRMAIQASLSKQAKKGLEMVDALEPSSSGGDNADTVGTRTDLTSVDESVMSNGSKGIAWWSSVVGRRDISKPAGMELSRLSSWNEDRGLTTNQLYRVSQKNDTQL